MSHLSVMASGNSHPLFHPEPSDHPQGILPRSFAFSVRRWPMPCRVAHDRFGSSGAREVNSPKEREIWFRTTRDEDYPRGWRTIVHWKGYALLGVFVLCVVASGRFLFLHTSNSFFLKSVVILPQGFIFFAIASRHHETVDLRGRTTPLDRAFPKDH
jgi:hypothetical protein